MLFGYASDAFNSDPVRRRGGRSLLNTPEFQSHETISGRVMKAIAQPSLPYASKRSFLITTREES